MLCCLWCVCYKFESVHMAQDIDATLHCAIYYRFSVGKAAVAGTSPSRTRSWWTWARLRRRWTKTARLITSKGSAVRSTHPLSTPPISAHSHTHTRLRLPSGTNATLQILHSACHTLSACSHTRARSLSLSRAWSQTMHGPRLLTV